MGQISINLTDNDKLTLKKKLKNKRNPYLNFVVNAF